MYRIQVHPPICTGMVLLLVLCTGGFLSPANARSVLRDVSETHLPTKVTVPDFSMSAASADLDGDGDLDLVVAMEFAPNRLLINDGSGSFSDQSAKRLAPITGDHEDVAAADFDGDRAPDLLFVGEDDQVQGYHRNDGAGTFSDLTSSLPPAGTANAVEAMDVDRDGDLDVFVGNNGQDFLWINDGTGLFVDETGARLPASHDITQDVASGDVDGDGDPDLLLGNEDGNRLLLNDGAGYFRPRANALLLRSDRREETRDADLVDLNGDGALDIFFANVQLFASGADPQDRLLLATPPDGFRDVTATHLPPDSEQTMTAGFVDLDGDGDLDLVAGSLGDLSGQTTPLPLRAFLNDGAAGFTLTPDLLPRIVFANAFDIEIGDYNNDGLPDAFVASRGGPDKLLLSGR